MVGKSFFAILCIGFSTIGSSSSVLAQYSTYDSENPLYDTGPSIGKSDHIPKDPLSPRTTLRPISYWECKCNGEEIPKNFLSNQAGKACVDSSGTPGQLECKSIRKF